MTVPADYDKYNSIVVPREARKEKSARGERREERRQDNE